MNDIFLSIIISGYNVDKFINPCLESFVKKDLSEVELLFVDDGSTDLTLFNVEIFSKKNNLNINVLTKDNGGVSSARNLGIKTARGKYITFIDGDDFIDFDEINKLCSLLKLNFSTILIGNYYNLEIDKNRCEKNALMTEYNNKKGLHVLESYFLKEISPSVWKAIYRRDFLIENNLFFLEGASVAEDFEWFFRSLYFCDKVSVVNSYYYYYRLRVGSIMRSEFSLEKYHSVIEVINSLIFFTRNNFIHNSKSQLRFDEQFLAVLIRGISMYKGKKDAKILRRILNELKVKSFKLKAFLYLVKVFPNLISKILHKKYNGS